MKFPLAQRRPGTLCVLAVSATLLALGACAVGPDYRPPVPETPAAWTTASADEPARHPVDLRHWWTRFEDPELSDLIDTAMAANLELRLAESRLLEAIALRKGALADLAPVFAGTADFTHRRAARNATASSSDGGGLSGSVSQSLSSLSGLGSPSGTFRFGDSAATLRLPAPGDADGRPEFSLNTSRGIDNNPTGFTRDRNAFGAGIGASWEIDIWGGIRRGVEAADAEIGAGVEDRRAVLVAVAAEVARNYILLRGLQRLVTVTEENIAIQRETLESIQSRFAASLATGTDVLQADIQLRRTIAELPPLEASVRTTIFRLSVLLGQPPGALLDRLGPPKPLPDEPELLPVGLPSDLLRRRPDIRAAERRLAAETARIGVEVAELFPRVSLVGDFGLQSAAASDVFDAGSLAWSFGPSVRWRLLEFGRIVSAIAVQEQRQQQALIGYHQLVLNALEQVETSMAGYAAQLRRSGTLAEVNQVNLRAFELAKSEYAVGMISFLSVLDTQRSLFTTQTELIRTRQQALAELVNLYEALGGGWPDDASLDNRDNS